LSNTPFRAFVVVNVKKVGFFSSLQKEEIYPLPSICDDLLQEQAFFPLAGLLALTHARWQKNLSKRIPEMPREGATGTLPDKAQ